MLAIGAAEGNLTVDGRKTSNYFGHTDPGNSVHNRGFCSWQAGPVSSVWEADIKCLNRIRSRIGHVSNLFEDAGLDVSKHKTAAVAALALKNGREGQQAIVHARVEAFRKNGVLSANGLFKICRTSKFYLNRLPYTVDSEQWQYNCIRLDQLRRQRQIERALFRHIVSSRTKVIDTVLNFVKTGV